MAPGDVTTVINDSNVEPPNKVLTFTSETKLLPKLKLKNLTVLVSRTHLVTLPCRKIEELFDRILNELRLVMFVLLFKFINNLRKNAKCGIRRHFSLKSEVDDVACK